MYYLSNLIFALLSPTVLLLSRETVNAGMQHFSLNNFYLLSRGFKIEIVASISHNLSALVIFTEHFVSKNSLIC